MVGRGVVSLALLCIAAGPVSSPAQDIRWIGSSTPLFIENPPGFETACRRYAWLCANPADETASRSEEQLRRMAAAVNRDVNREIQQATDREVYGTDEKWALPDRGRGDCEDLALEKMRRLINRGVPSDRLAIAIVLDRRGDNHAVLLLSANGSYIVLDSLTDRLLGPREAGFRMLAMQSTRDRSRWVVSDGIAIAGLDGRKTPGAAGPAPASGGAAAPARVATRSTSAILPSID